MQIACDLLLKSEQLAKLRQASSVVAWSRYAYNRHTAGVPTCYANSYARYLLKSLSAATESKTLRLRCTAAPE